MKKQDSTLLGFAIVLLAVIGLCVYYKKDWKWYVGGWLIVAPLGAYIGYALGKEDPALEAQKKLELERATKCKDLGGNYVDGQCKKTLMNQILDQSKDPYASNIIAL